MYQEQIDKLKWVVEYWELAKDNSFEASRIFYAKFKTSLTIYGGLCENCLKGIPVSTKARMFRNFVSFSGSIVLPLDHVENFYKMRNYTETPLRLELAKHCIKYLEDLQQ